MSKPNSNHFLGTKGQRIYKYLAPSIQRILITSWAKETATFLVAKSKRKRDNFKTACLAVDEKTGNLYFGRNGGINKDATNADINEVLVGNNKKAGILPIKSLNAYPTPWNCAETHAINQALNDGAKLENIHIFTIDTTTNGLGKAKKSCINCTTAYKGRIKKNNTGWFN